LSQNNSSGNYDNNNIYIILPKSPYPYSNDKFYFYIYPPKISELDDLFGLVWFNKTNVMTSSNYLYTLDSNVSGIVENTIVKNTGETDDAFVNRILGQLLDNQCAILSYTDNTRTTIQNAKIKVLDSIPTPTIFDKSMPIDEGGTFTGQITFYKLGSLSTVINNWSSINNNNHYYYSWTDYADMVDTFVFSGLYSST